MTITNGPPLGNSRQEQLQHLIEHAHMLDRLLRRLADRPQQTLATVAAAPIDDRLVRRVDKLTRLVVGAVRFGRRVVGGLLLVQRAFEARPRVDDRRDGDVLGLEVVAQVERAPVDAIVRLHGHEEAENALELTEYGLNASLTRAYLCGGAYL